ncbi:NUDIX domain-containing protein [Streptomyces sp. NPDC049040]|uniref:NUDIX domain-containing protein n=1 Tax=Streptomyces sp. NPDC049040 TaxID=3365593 RepID=UPI003718F573
MNTPEKLTASAAALLTDGEGRLLVVKPTYKSGWNLPGGHVDEGETPRDACRRELREELALDVEPGRLLVHAFMAGHGRSHVYYVFEGGALTSEQQGSIVLQEEELAEYRFIAELPVEDIPAPLRPAWDAVMQARADGESTYLELR